MAKHIPVMRCSPLIKGFLCGSFLAGAIAIPYGLLIQAALLIVSILLLVDSTCVFGREKHIVSFLFLMGLGLITGFLIFFAGYLGLYILLMFLVLAGLYLVDYAMKR